MTQINLLPWREQARQARKMEFVYVLAAFIGLTLIFVFIGHLYYGSLISHQQKNNAFLQEQLDQEQQILNALNKKKKQQTLIYSQLNFLISLQEKSYQVVRMLDELVRVIPDGVALLKVTREKNSVTMYGKANSNLQVTQFMENIEKSSVFKQPILTEIAAKDGVLREEKYFQLQVEQEK